MLLECVRISGACKPANAARTLVLIILTGPFLRAQRERPFYAAGPLDSPRMAALARAVEAGDRAATVAAFWDEIRKTSTPLIEPVTGEAQYSWVTFLWQQKENTV